MLRLAGIHERRIPYSIPGRELEPIIELPLPGILLAMIKRFGRYSATSLCMCLALATGVCRVSGAWADDSSLADRVIVHKAEHKLYLYNGDRLLGVYKVALGLSPVGQKERERDYKTPEGRYFLARRNTRSDYFLAIQVSYPNKQDELRAHKKGWAPGGAIMIHGFPNSPHHPWAYYDANDWTDGCIALSNSDMVEVWMRTQDNIPIDIYP
jgi:L,D-transpeptidase catalytic domain